MQIQADGGSVSDAGALVTKSVAELDLAERLVAYTDVAAAGTPAAAACAEAATQAIRTSESLRAVMQQISAKLAKTGSNYDTAEQASTVKSTTSGPAERWGG